MENTSHGLAPIPSRYDAPANILRVITSINFDNIGDPELFIAF